MKLYHASPNQNLKYIEPEKQDTSNIDNVYEKKKEIYASNDKSYAAGFCFNWSVERGFKFGRIDSIWEMKVPPKYIQRLKYPCSIYEVESKGFVNISDHEFASTTKVKVINEEKYYSCYDCLKQNGVRISILKRKPFMDNALIKKFRDIIQKRKSE